jgi:hypothetical protein
MDQYTEPAGTVVKQIDSFFRIEMIDSEYM